MTPDAVIRTWFEEVWNQGREDAIDRYLAVGGVAHDIGPADLVGPDAFKEYHRALRQALADIRIDVLQTVTEGDRTVAHCRVRARHVGDMPGAPASNALVDFNGVTILRVQDDQIVEGWNCFDFLRMYQQMGATPLPA